MNKQKLFKKLLDGSKNIAFQDILTLAKAFGFVIVRTGGSHTILSHPDVSELLNLQNVKGQVKPYQVKQFLQIVERYNLQLGEGR